MAEEQTRDSQEQKARKQPFDHKALLEHLSSRPGVYRMYDARGKVLYVGKARNLKKRVGNYFRGSGLDTKTMSMVTRIADVEVTITSNETEALLLEQSLIKKHRPPYNIKLRDDKSYPYIMVTDRNEFPRLAFYRGSQRRDAKLFGPYPSASAVRETLGILQKVFRLRQCEDSYFLNRSRPCLQYQIDRCTAPCVGYISAEDYARDVRDAEQFLGGKSDALIRDLERRMEAKAEELEFEQAGRIRDQIQDLRRIQEQQDVAGQGSDADVLAAALEGGYACVHMVFIRGGRIIGSKNFFPRDELADSAARLLEDFIAQYYVRDGNGRNIPGELIISPAIDDHQALQSALGYCAGRKVRLATAVRDYRARWQSMAQTNAGDALQAHISNRQNTRQRFQQLQEALKLPELPQRIECFDISHTKGESTVASCVVFDTNGARKSDYRRFNIRDVAEGDDYAAMEQALSRRYTRLAGEVQDTAIEEARMPDLVLIDGGKGQLARARQVMQDCQIEGVSLLGIAKGVSRRAGQETLLLAEGERQKEIALPEHSPALHLLQQIRDEAHRFAITGHRQRRGKTRNTSPLEEIPGLGPKRRRALLRHFGGQQEVLRASEQQLAAVEGISKKLATDIYATLHNE